METWKYFIGKKVKIIFEDGDRHFSRKIGKLIGESPTHLFLEIDEKREGLKLSKILRVEEIENVI